MNKIHQEGGKLSQCELGVNLLYGKKLKIRGRHLNGIVPGIRVAIRGVLEGREPTACGSDLALLLCFPLLLELPPTKMAISLIEDPLKPLRSSKEISSP
jgi:hypothetical protein